VALAYLASGILFIMALRGLSSPASSRRGNRFGILGMTIAVVTTLLTHVPRTADGALDAISIAEVLGRSGLAR
jgi:NAD(P) transhydrogenase subunit beta